MGPGGCYRCCEHERARRDCLDIGRFVWQGRVVGRGQDGRGVKSWSCGKESSSAARLLLVQIQVQLQGPIEDPPLLDCLSPWPAHHFTSLPSFACFGFRSYRSKEGEWATRVTGVVRACVECWEVMWNGTGDVGEMLCVVLGFKQSQSTTGGKRSAKRESPGVAVREHEREIIGGR